MFGCLKPTIKYARSLKYLWFSSPVYQVYVQPEKSHLRMKPCRTVTLLDCDLVEKKLLFTTTYEVSPLCYMVEIITILSAGRGWCRSFTVRGLQAPLVLPQTWNYMHLRCYLDWVAIRCQFSAGNMIFQWRLLNFLWLHENAWVRTVCGLCFWSFPNVEIAFPIEK